MAVVQGLVRDAGNALHRPRDAVTYRMTRIELAEKLIVYRHAGVILAHEDFLRDYALLLLHRLRREIRGGDKMQQQAQVFLKGFCALKIVAGHVAGGESVWLRAVCGEKIHRAVAIRQVEHLVLKKMRHARRGVDGLAVQLKAPVGSAVIRGEGGVEGRKALLRDDAEPESVRKLGAVQRFAYIRVIMLLHRHPRPPRNRCPLRNRSCHIRRCWRRP